MNRRIVGIDLGTTHSVLAWTDETLALRGASGIEIFAVPQLVSPTEIAAQPLFPSVLYAPIAGEVAEDFWGDAPYWLGAAAKRRGIEVEGRSIASAKSWLGYAAVDRTASILPWGADEQPGTNLQKISPVDASAKILSHLRAAYDSAYPNAPLAEQEVILTVPASFDEDARELTVLAAERAGLSVRLLEEPQAAFYDFAMRAHGTGAQPTLRATNDALTALCAAGPAHVLVCDVGGGTTDLSLLRVEPDENETAPAKVTRIAVGNHLLLGGDNMDLALAYACEPRLIAPPDRLSPSRFAQLVLACRAAKEKLLGDGAPASVPVVIATGGSRLFGNTLRTDLSAEDVLRLVLEGFFPEVSADSKPSRGRSALVAFGLPYEKDPAITKHIAAFLARHQVFAAGGKIDAVLFNGGVFRSRAIGTRLLATLGKMSGTEVRALAYSDPDLAVAAGAVAYGLALRGVGLRIRGGAARGYYVGLSPDAGKRRTAVCVVPRGANEGIRYSEKDRTFALAVGRSVRFDLFTSDTAQSAPGDVVELVDDVFEKLPPAVVRFDVGAQTSGRRIEHGEVKVAIEGELSAVGTLDLACVALGDDRRFKLKFQLREADEGRDASPRRVFSSQKVADACDCVERVFGKGRPDVAPRQVKDLLRDLEKMLGERSHWTIEVARALFDTLGPSAKSRKRSADHERMFWLLAGFCLRPGFGDPGDPMRAQMLSPLISEKLTFSTETRIWQQFWIAWRRVSGGLDEAAQKSIRDLVDPFLAPSDKRLKKPKGFKPDALVEMLDMAASLERIAASDRAELGAWILEKTWTDRDPRWWAALGRIGARVPSYASVHHVVSPLIAEKWLDHLLREKWDEMPTCAGAAVQLARVTGDRARDVSERVRAEVEKRLVKAGAREAWTHAVREFLPVDEADRAAFFGEGLPLGLRLLG